MTGSIVRSNRFQNRIAPWSGLGRSINGAESISEALSMAGLDWQVKQYPIETIEAVPQTVNGFQANIREDNGQVLGIVTDRYKLVQNEEAFAFTNSLIEEGVSFLSAGVFQGGRKVWILGKLPERYIISGDEVSPYIVFINSHDGSGSIKAAMTPVRVICQNMLNLAIRRAARYWSANHTGDISGKLQDARDTLIYAGNYMGALGKEIEAFNRIKVSDAQASLLLDQLLPLDESMTDMQKKNVNRQREDLMSCYYEAPDLKELGKNGYRFLNAVSDFATHAEPIRKTNNYRESLFARTIEGNPIIDRACQLLQTA